MEKFKNVSGQENPQEQPSAEIVEFPKPDIALENVSAKDVTPEEIKALEEQLGLAEEQPSTAGIEVTDLTAEVDNVDLVSPQAVTEEELAAAEAALDALDPTPQTGKLEAAIKAQQVDAAAQRKQEAENEIAGRDLNHGREAA